MAGVSNNMGKFRRGDEVVLAGTVDGKPAVFPARVLDLRGTWPEQEARLQLGSAPGRPERRVTLTMQESPIGALATVVAIDGGEWPWTALYDRNLIRSLQNDVTWGPAVDQFEHNNDAANTVDNRARQFDLGHEDATANRRFGFSNDLGTYSAALHEAYVRGWTSGGGDPETANQWDRFQESQGWRDATSGSTFGASFMAAPAATDEAPTMAYKRGWDRGVVARERVLATPASRRAAPELVEVKVNSDGRWRDFKDYTLLAHSNEARNAWDVEAVTQETIRGVAKASFVGVHDDAGRLVALKVWEVEVEPGARGQGLASAMYEFAGSVFGLPLQPGDFQTPDGRGFRASIDAVGPRAASALDYDDAPAMRGPADIHQAVTRHLGARTGEMFLLLGLDGQHRIRVIRELGPSVASVVPKTMFGPLRRAKATIAVLVHQLASGQDETAVDRSRLRVALIRDVALAGEKARIPLLDFMVLTDDGYVSFVGLGLLPAAEDLDQAREYVPTRRTAKDIARAIIRDLAYQDLDGDEPGTADEQIEGWYRSASAGGDRLVTAAIDVLGRRAAAAAYAMGPQELPRSGDGRMTPEEEQRLLAAQDKAYTSAASQKRTAKAAKKRKSAKKVGARKAKKAAKKISAKRNTAKKASGKKAARKAGKRWTEGEVRRAAEVLGRRASKQGEPRAPSKSAAYAALTTRILQSRGRSMEQALREPTTEDIKLGSIMATSFMRGWDGARKPAAKKNATKARTAKRAPPAKKVTAKKVTKKAAKKAATKRAKKTVKKVAKAKTARRRKKC